MVSVFTYIILMERKKAVMNIKQLYVSDWLVKYSTKDFEEMFTYDADDLGMRLEGENIVLKCWSPFAAQMELNIYLSGEENSINVERIQMVRREKGIWQIALEASGYLNKYYDFTIVFENIPKNGSKAEVTACDPYARAVGVNGKKAMFIDLTETNPEGWDTDRNPNQSMAWNDMVIYELHIRDLSVDLKSGIKNRGKFLGLIENGTYITDGMEKFKTGLDHIKDLGITHLHLLPFYDYGSIDESQSYDENKYNWGYDPVNYNVPEGSYSTNPYDGDVRIRELKQTICQLHQNGISVVMDVVYNHTYNEEFCFNKMVPGYFYRIGADGVLSNGSECGNDTASERSMVRKYIVDSVLYWAKEYHIDGFRFDLLGLLDTETMQEIRKGLDNIRPNILIYGEGWKLQTVLTKKNMVLATQEHVSEMDRVAMFSDNLRDAIKGSVFEETEKGYISGNQDCVEAIKISLMGLPEWADYPEQVINYTSCHDNYTLFDKIALCNKEIDMEERIRQNKLAIAIVMLSQGIPLLHAGEELLRTKMNQQGEFVSDSVRDGDDVNSIKWETLLQPEYQNVYQYYKGLTAFRKNTRVLHMTDPAEIRKAYLFAETGNELVICFKAVRNDEIMIVVFNADEKTVEINLNALFVKEEKLNGIFEGKKYQCYINEQAADCKPVSATIYDENDCTVEVQAQSCMVLKNIQF